MQNANFDAVYKQLIGKEYVLDCLDQCSLQVVTAKFDMSDDLVRSILKVKVYKFVSLNVLVKYNSCNTFVI